LSFFLERDQEINFLKLLSFSLLIIGSILISFKRKKSITFQSISISGLAAFLFSLSFVLTKLAYASQPFWSAFIWMRIGGFLTALVFLVFPGTRKEIFKSGPKPKKQLGILVLIAQGLGAVALILQNWAIALVPFSFLPFINALEGMKYLFLLFLVGLVSRRFPNFLKEEISKNILIQKLVAVSLIIIGLVILSLLRNPAT